MGSRFARSRRAMFVALCGVAVAVGCGRGGGPSAAPTPDAAHAAVPSERLPAVGAVTDEPDAARSIVVAVRRDGALVFGSHVGGLPELRAHLAERTRDPAPRHASGASELSLVLRVDRDAPWTLALWAMAVGAAAPIRLDRVHVAVRPEAGGPDGVVDTFLPVDAPIFFGKPAPAPVSLRVASASSAADRRAVYEALRRACRAGVTEAAIDVPAERVPRAGAVLDVVDLARRAGVRWFRFSTQAFPRATPDGRVDLDVATLAWLQQYAAMRADAPAGAAVSVAGVRVAAQFAGVPASPLPPPPPRARRPSADDDADGPGLSDHLVETEVVGRYGDDDGPAGVAPPDVADGDDVGAAERARAVACRRSLARGGGPDDGRVSTAVASALAWLAAHRTDDGTWTATSRDVRAAGAERPPAPDGASRAVDEPDHEVGVTALATLAFLGAGHLDRGDGPWTSVVRRALRWLVRAQDAEGCFGRRDDPRHVYDHALATLAVVDAYALTGDPRLRPPAQRALDFIALARNPERAWRYGVKPGDDDTSVTAWMVTALAAARAVVESERARATPSLEVDADAFDGALRWVEAMTDPTTGRVGYQQRGAGPARPPSVADRFPADRSEAATAAGVWVRLCAGETVARSPALARGVERLLARPPASRDDGSLDFCGWHLAAVALHRVDGPSAQAWWRSAVDVIVARQRTDGSLADVRGSFDPVDVWGDVGGRVYATALLAWTLETPTREPAPRSSRDR